MQRQLFNWCPVTPVPLNLYELLERILLYFFFFLTKLFPNHLLDMYDEDLVNIVHYWVIQKKNSLHLWVLRHSYLIYFSHFGFAVGPKKLLYFS